MATLSENNAAAQLTDHLSDQLKQGFEKSAVVLSAQAVRDAERHWASNNNNSTWPLMVKAASSFVQRFEAAFNASQSILVVVGQGNNGGDGYYIAKLLLQQGKNVVVYAPFGAPKAGIDAQQAMNEFLAAGGRVRANATSLAASTAASTTAASTTAAIATAASTTAAIATAAIATAAIATSESYPIIIDALFGSGLSRTLSAAAIEVINYINHSSGQVYAVDVPSGLNADSGQPEPVCVHASATHSFIAYKPGLLTAYGPASCGELSLDTLELEPIASTTKENWRYDPRVNKLPSRTGNTHKSHHGNVGVIAGLGNMAGAGIIASRAALNAGAGRVYLQCEPSHFVACLSQSPEIMFSETTDNTLQQNAVLVVGPGLGRGPQAQQIMQTILTLQANSGVDNKRSLGVLDADGLRYLAKQPQMVAHWVLTPHEAEAADLLGISADEVTNDRLAAALALHKKYKAVVVLKGAGTLVAHQGGVNFCHSGSAAMATAGMGDCLAGIIAALIAQGLSAEDAAITGVNWHATLGHQLAQTQRIVLASDICEQLKLSCD
ncbi:bifunctional ADP-dependent NAD(P)H-hydrate dehydratase/NAD(P)H-hydrate epimerase [Shewanella sp. UCD-KL21]|uniref:bifunctional ADP-dependent NAD(P)H-hydrate dehydratase/NAD(P)H-hydrate epimerase n=1 Tax=Shewanella sp. UCD-KL21 TaxID=1917164 RepID=UPI000970C055|nr:bifunctional ADP-dependent NAD(P)H-hydrate dehydratase/NAD(P)H-hydrate epimerase [Shewanella sp. UCD-KL21]